MEKIEQVAALIAEANRAAGLTGATVGVGRRWAVRISGKNTGIIHPEILCLSDDEDDLRDGLAKLMAPDRKHKDGGIAGGGDLSQATVFDKDDTDTYRVMTCMVPVSFDVAYICDEPRAELAATNDDGDESEESETDAAETDITTRVSTATARLLSVAEHLRRIGFIVKPEHRIIKSGDSTEHLFEISGVMFLKAAIQAPNHEMGDEAETAALLRLLPDSFVHPSSREGEDGATILCHSELSYEVLASVVLGDMTAEEFIACHSMTAERLGDLADVWERDASAPENVRFDLFARSPLTANRQQGVEFIVKNLLPISAVSLLAGPSGAGKSTLAHDLAVAVASTAAGADGMTWLGQPINKKVAKGRTVFLAGEDSEGTISMRLTSLDPERRSLKNTYYWTAGESNLTEIIGQIESIGGHIDLLIVDPLAKYLEGDENDTNYANRLMKQLEYVAIKYKCAVLVIHHLKKDSNPVNIAGQNGVGRSIRGSGVFKERARMVFGMFLRGSQVVVGIDKTSFPPECGVEKVDRVFTREPKTLRLLPVHGAEGPRSTEASAHLPSESDPDADLHDAILVAVARLTAEGKKVSKTGARHGLYEHRCDELASWTRANVWAGVDRLLATDRLILSEGRLRISNAVLLTHGSGNAYETAA